MKFLLDTSTLVHVLRGRGHDAIVERLRQAAIGSTVISPLVRLELLNGARRQRDPDAAVAHVQRFLADFSSLAFDDGVADRAAGIRAALFAAGTPIGPYDLLIAATAVFHGLILVTCNTKEFARVEGLSVEDWAKAT